MTFSFKTILRYKHSLFFALTAAVVACAGSGGSASSNPPVGATAAPVSTAPTSDWWIPAPGSSFQYDLSDAGLPTPSASMVDLDWEATSASNVAALHVAGSKAVCYVDAGTEETWRPDASSFPAVVIGNADAGWPGEFWLDVRRYDILGPIMTARIATCKQKGFDAVEFDNIDGYGNNTGFPLTLEDGENYLTKLAQVAHGDGLAVALKNAPEMLPAILPTVDFAIDEDCWQQGWCSSDAALRTAKKLVVDVEYDDVTTLLQFDSIDCPAAAALGDTAILKHRTLDAWIATCPS